MALMGHRSARYKDQLVITCRNRDDAISASVRVVWYLPDFFLMLRVGVAQS